MIYELRDDEMLQLIENDEFITHKQYTALHYKGVKVKCHRSYLPYKQHYFVPKDPHKLRLLVMGKEEVEREQAIVSFLDDLEESINIGDCGEIVLDKRTLLKSLRKLLDTKF